MSDNIVGNASRRQFLAAAGVMTAGLMGVGAANSGDDPPPLAPPDKQPPDLDVPDVAERKVGWAIVGLGKLALEEVMPAFAQCRLSRPTALVSGHADKAKRVAAAYGINAKNIYNYENYDRLVDNSDVDAIYIILPNSMHAEYTIRGVKAGKNVLCEKPMAVTVEESEKMIVAAHAAKKLLMIAYRLRYEPFNRKVIELCRKQELGAIKTISTSNCQDVKAPNIRLSRELGGGPLGDIGVYCLNAARYITGQEPTEVAAFSQQPKNEPRFREVPESVSFSLRFPDGVLAQCDCSFGSGESRRYRVHCTEGYIDLDPAFSYRGLQLRVRRGQEIKRLELPHVDHFASEMDHFSECILKNKPPRTPGEEGLADMRVMIAIEEAARSGRVEKVRSA